MSKADDLRVVDLTRQAVTELADGDERIANVDLTRDAVNALADELDGVTVGEAVAVVNLPEGITPESGP